MKKFMLAILAMILTLSAFSVQASPAYALGAPTRVLVAQLSGLAIDGVVPSGKAEFAASQGATSLDVGMFNLNLADGTCLNIAFGRTVFQGVPVIRGGASFSFFPSPEEVRPGELITISIGEPPVGQSTCLFVLAPAAGTAILSGTFQDSSNTK